MLSNNTIDFLNELRVNNNKEWFDLNRGSYEKVKVEYHNVVNDMLQEMQKFDPSLSHLKVKDCTFRINRDIRFSKDKTPYKTHLGIAISPFGRKFEYAGYYVHLDPGGNTFAGGGIYMPSADALKKIRKEVDVFHEDLEEIIKSKSFSKTFGALDRDEGMVLKRPPKGYAETHPAIEILKLKSFTATRLLDNKVLTDTNGLASIIDILKQVKPLNEFINRGLRA